MRSLVIGGTGFLGSYIVPLLLERGDNVVIFSRQRSSDCLSCFRTTPDWRTAETSGQIRAVRGDVLDADSVKLAAQGCDRIFHFSGAIWGSVATEVMGTRSVIQAAEATGASIIYASTSNVYGRLDVNNPAREDQAVEPLSDYGVSKHYCEGLLEKSANNHRVRSVILRIFKPFGPGQDEKMSVPRFFRAAMTGDSIIVYGSGHQTRDYIFASDAARITVCLADNVSGYEVFNIGSGTETSVLDIINTILLITGSKSPIVHHDTPIDRMYLEVERRYASIEKIKRKNCFPQCHSLRTGLEIMHEHYCQQRNNAELFVPR